VLRLLRGVEEMSALRLSTSSATHLSDMQFYAVTPRAGDGIAPFSSNDDTNGVYTDGWDSFWVFPSPFIHHREYPTLDRFLSGSTSFCGARYRLLSSSSLSAGVSREVYPIVDARLPGRSCAGFRGLRDIGGYLGGEREGHGESVFALRVSSRLRGVRYVGR